MLKYVQRTKESRRNLEKMYDIRVHFPDRFFRRFWSGGG